MSLISPKNIIISRTDSIGDVVLTFPVCQRIKENFPSCKIIFLGRNYTKPVIESFGIIDQFLSWDEIESLPTSEEIMLFRSLQADTIIHVFPNKEIAALAKKAKIPNRIGTSHRLFHFLTCNYRLDFSRKKSNLHESQLNFELLKPLGLTTIPSLEEINSNLLSNHLSSEKLPEQIDKLISSQEKIIILHPKSQGSAREWPMDKYIELSIELSKMDYIILFSGTESEGALFREKIPVNPKIIDTTGQLSLQQFMYLISKSYALIACSTGPLHIAGMLGIKAIGLFSNMRPIHPGRWRPLGKNSTALVFDENCPTCQKKKNCNCIEKISVEQVLKDLSDLKKLKLF